MATVIEKAMLKADLGFASETPEEISVYMEG